MSESLLGSNRWLKTGLLLPIVVLNGWVLIQVFHYLEPLVTIFIVAAILAFILNYPVEWLQNYRLDRTYAVFIVLAISAVTLGTLGVTLFPALLEQVSSIVEQLPDWANAASQKLQVIQTWASSHRLPINLNRVIREVTNRFPEQLESLSDETISLALNAAGGLSSLFLTIVLTLYLLLDGKRVWKAIFQLFPASYREPIRQALQHDFHRYFIGQATLGLILSTALAIAYFVLHVPYSLLLAFTVGVMSLIPFGDALAYGVIALLLATHSPGLALTVLVVSLVVDQILDQAIAPRILGGFTGLKPVWIVIALLLGTRLFGVPGLLIAVPIASFVGTLLEAEVLPGTPEKTSGDREISSNPEESEVHALELQR